MPIQRAKPRLVDLDQTPLTSMPTGSVIQTVSTTDMTAASFTGTSSVDPKTVISLAITLSISIQGINFYYNSARCCMALFCNKRGDRL